MTKFTQVFSDPAPAGYTGYAKAESLPSLSAGEALYIPGTLFWDTPTADAWGGSNGSASIVGTPGTTGLAVDATNKLTFPRAERTVFNVNSAMTQMIILKATMQQQQFMGTYASGGLPYTLFGMSDATTLRCIGHNGTVGATSNVTAPTNMASNWTLIFGVHTLTSSLVAYFRTSTGLVVSQTPGTRTSSAPGSTLLGSQVGGAPAAAWGTSAATVAATGELQTAVTQAQMIAIAAEAVKLMASIGETL